MLIYWTAVRLTTVTVFDRQARGLIGKDVDEMCIISKLENGESTIESIFQQSVGLHATFEFRPTNYEINNPVACKTTANQQIQPKEFVNDAAIFPHVVQVIAESMGESKSGHNNYTADYKGKSVMAQKQGQKTERQGIIIHDGEQFPNAKISNGSKLANKRQKKGARGNTSDSV